MPRTSSNLILQTDSYKLSHFKQYPPGTEQIYSYFESRLGSKFNGTLFFGLQYFLKEYLEGIVITKEKIDQAELIAKAHVGHFNREGWEYILNKHNGMLPIEIQAVPEGSWIKTSQPLMAIFNTDSKCYWLPNYLETLLVQIWYPCNVATISKTVKDMLIFYAKLTGCDESLVDFKLHDFGFRGSTGTQAAGLGGLAHLVNFKGTDTIEAIGYGIQYYDSGICGFSIPASEHSTITSWGKEHEVDAYRNMLNQYPEGLVACVSDSYDIDNACTNLWGKELKEEVLKRNGVLVVRPDSGEIVSMVRNVLTRLADAFGFYKNSKGFKVLNDKVRVIQGDGCTLETIEDVLSMMVDERWSIENIAFGMGGGLLQKHNRDTQRFAFKCSQAIINGKAVDVRKDPKSDPSKASKSGRVTHPAFRTVFRNGEILINETFDTIRKRSNG